MEADRQANTLAQLVGVDHMMGFSGDEMRALWRLLRSDTDPEPITLSVEDHRHLMAIATSIEESLPADILSSWLTTPTTLATDIPTEQKS